MNTLINCANTINLTDHRQDFNFRFAATLSIFVQLGPTSNIMCTLALVMSSLDQFWIPKVEWKRGQKCSSSIKAKEYLCGV